MYKPALSNTRNTQVEYDPSLPLHEDTISLTDLAERFAYIIQETWRRVSYLKGFEPHVSEPQVEGLQYWSDFQARRDDSNWGDPRKAALFAVEEIFDFRKTPRTVDETIKPSSERKR